MRSEICTCCFERNCFGCHAGEDDYRPVDCFGQPLDEEDDDDED